MSSIIKNPFDINNVKTFKKKARLFKAPSIVPTVHGTPHNNPVYKDK